MNEVYVEIPDESTIKSLFFGLPAIFYRNRNKFAVNTKFSGILYQFTLVLLYVG